MWRHQHREARNARSQVSNSQTVFNIYIIIFTMLIKCRYVSLMICVFFRGSAKWEAWNGKKGMDQEEAKRSYIELAGTLQEKHGLA